MAEFLYYQLRTPKLRLEITSRAQGVKPTMKKLNKEAVWLTQQQMAELFQRERSVITKHIRNIFEEGELVEEAVCANFARAGATG